MKERQYKHRSETPHDFTKEPVCEGRVVKHGVLTIEGKDREFIVVDTQTSLSQVFQSHALDDAFKVAEEGDGIRIVFAGKKRLQGGKTFNKFSVSVWEWSEADEEKEDPTPTS